MRNCRPMISLAAMFAVLLLFVHTGPAFAQARISMLPPSIESPLPNAYHWGDRLLFSFRFAGEPSEYRVEGEPDIRFSPQENVVTLEVPLDNDGARRAASAFASGALVFPGKVTVSRRGEPVAEQRFWILNGARRWPDALQRLQPGNRPAGEPVKVGVELLEDRLSGNYRLELYLLGSRLPGGAQTIAEQIGQPVVIRNGQDTYELKTGGTTGVHEVRLRGPGGFVHDVLRYQAVPKIPKVRYVPGKVEKDEFGEVHYGTLEVSEYPPSKRKALNVQRLGNPNAFANNTSRVADSVSQDQTSWTTKHNLSGPTEFQVTTAYLDDEIVIGRFSGGGEAGPVAPDVSDVSAGDVYRVGEPVTYDDDWFSEGDQPYFLRLRENVSGRSPKHTPASPLDRLIKNYRVAKKGRFAIDVPGLPGDYRLDREEQNEDGRPSGIVSFTAPFSVMGEDSGIVVKPLSERVALGDNANFAIEMPPRPFAGKVSVQVVRPGGATSYGVRMADRSPQMLHDHNFLYLWDPQRAANYIPEESYTVGWDTILWAPGRYELRFLMERGVARGEILLKTHRFDVVVPPVPEAFGELEREGDDVFLNIQLPSWANPQLRRFFIATITPGARSPGGALRFDAIGKRQEIKEFDIGLDKKARVPLNFDLKGANEFALLMNVGCFAGTCPTAELDRRSYPAPAKEADGNEDDTPPIPPRLAAEFKLPEDTSLARLGRQFPDLDPDK